jgi:hypothetical protein
VTAAGASSALAADAQSERLTDAVRRYATSPLALDHPPPTAPIRLRWFFTAIAAENEWL